MKNIILIISAIFVCQTAFAQPAMDEAFKSYSENGKLKFDAKRGQALWIKKFPDKTGKDRQCTTCHGQDLTKPGKHTKSGKIIEAMAPSANNTRYTKLKKINKWFKRNCKWTLGRECTNQEKGDILKYLSQQ